MEQINKTYTMFQIKREERKRSEGSKRWKSQEKSFSFGSLYNSFWESFYEKGPIVRVEALQRVSQYDIHQCGSGTRPVQASSLLLHKNISGNIPVDTWEPL